MAKIMEKVKEPTSFEKALVADSAWKVAVKEEYGSIMKNKTWELCLWKLWFANTNEINFKHFRLVFLLHLLVSKFVYCKTFKNFRRHIEVP